MKEIDKTQIQKFTIPNDWFKADECGHSNGYVAIPIGHTLYNVDYDKIMEMISVNQELTFGQIISDTDSYKAYKDIWKKYEDMYVIGFDTHHSGDNRRNWPLSRVKRETTKLYNLILNFKINNSDNDTESKTRI